MKLDKLKRGPSSGRPSTTRHITLRLDAEAEAALQVIEDELWKRGVKNARSAAVRGALLEAAARIQASRKK
jgi:hypothetical protein